MNGPIADINRLPLVTPTVPQGRWRTLTFLAALRCDRLDAPCVIDGPINGESFLAYVEQLLVPTLKPGDVVIMDNLGSHKRNAIRRTIRAARRKALLPAALLARPHSHRASLRKAQSTAVQGCRAKRRGNLETHRQPLRRLHTAECALYLANAG